MTAPPVAPQPRRSGKTNWGCVGLAAVVGLLGVYAIGRAVPPTADAPAVLATAAPTWTPRPAQATAAPTAQPLAIGTRARPVPFGAAYRFDKFGQVYTVQVVEVVPSANAKMREASALNPDPAEGEDYILVRLRLLYQSGPNDRPLRTTNGAHTLYADNRLFGAPMASTPPQPAFQGVDILPGGSRDGWLDGKHLPKALMNDAVLVYDGVYFALK